MAREVDVVLGIIGGSGLYQMEGAEVVAEHAISTPFGQPSDAIVETRLGDRTVFFFRATDAVIACCRRKCRHEPTSAH